MTKLTSINDWKKSTYMHDHISFLNPHTRSDRSFILKFEKFIGNKTNNKKIIEIGCCPGRFLAYFYKKYSLKSFGIDYDKNAIAMMKDEFKKRGVQSQIINADFTKYRSKHKFDYVCSFGFVEHFDNETLDKVLKNHVNITSSKGFIFISMPNLTYLNKFFFKLFKPDLLAKHNTKIMNKDFFKHFAKKNNLKIIELNYFGGFHLPGMSKLSRFKALAYLLNHKIFDNLNSKYFSHYIGCIYKKN